MRSRKHVLLPGTVLNRKGQNAGGVARAIRGRVANLWVFHSNKSDKLLFVLSDVLFAHVVIADVDPSVLSYQLEEELPDSSGHVRTKVPDLILGFSDGTTEIWRCRREAGEDGDAPKADIPIRLKTSVDVENNRFLFDNSLLLSTALTAAHDYDICPACQAIRRHLWHKSQATIGDLTSLPDVDPALLFAALTRLVMDGEVSMDLRSKLLSMSSTVTRSGKGEMK